jgi:hypothetical protein
LREKNEAPCDDAASDFECGRTRSITKEFLPTVKLVNLSTGVTLNLPPNCASHIDPKRTVGGSILVGRV